MRVVRITWAGKTAYLRDPYELGNFLHGIECNEHGIGLREGCRENRELMVRLDRITSIEELTRAVA